MADDGSQYLVLIAAGIVAFFALRRFRDNGNGGGGGGDPCAGVSCADCQVCEDGSCVPVEDPCCGISCPTGEVCDGGQCVPTDPGDPCDDVTCGNCQTCVDGQCVPVDDPCCGVTCGDCLVCEDGNCVPVDDPCCGVADPCCGVDCPSGEECVDGNCEPTNGGGGGGDNEPPTVYIDSYDVPSHPTLEVGAESNDPDGSIVSHDWTLRRDGTPVSTATGNPTTLTLSGDGQYEITVVVTDDDGAQAQDSISFPYSAP